MDKNSSSEDNRTILSHSEGVIQKSGIGSHSYNDLEFETMSTLNMYEMLDKAKGIKRDMHNDGVSRYFLISDGKLIKYNKEKKSLKILDLDNKVWVEDKNSINSFFDNSLRFQELLNFKDYYDDELDLSQGKRR